MADTEARRGTSPRSPPGHPGQQAAATAEQRLFERRQQSSARKARQPSMLKMTRASVLSVVSNGQAFSPSGSKSSPTSLRRTSAQGAPPGDEQASGEHRLSLASQGSYQRSQVHTPTTYDAAQKDDLSTIEKMMASWPLIKSCTPGLPSLLAARVQIQSFTQNQEIVHSGLFSTSLVFIIRGTVNITAGDMKVGRLTIGQYLGEALMLGIEEYWNVTLVTGCEGCTIGEISQADFQSACKLVSDMDQWFEALKGMRRVKDADGWLGNFELFHGLSESTLEATSQSMSTRIVFPGELVMEEGTPGYDLFLLLQGRVVVEISGSVVRTHDRSESKQAICLGELGLLGLEHVRSSSVIAQTVSLVRRIFRPVFLRQLQENADCMQIQNVVNLMKTHAIKRCPILPARQGVQNVKIFREAGCSRAFLHFLGENLEERIYLCDQTILNDSTCERCLYVLTLGSAKVVERGRTVAALRSGAIIGEMHLLGVGPRMAGSIVATDFCHMEVLHLHAVVQGLEKFEEERPKVFAAAYADMTGSQVSTATMDQETRNALLAEVVKVPLFEGMNTSFIEQLSALAVDRIYLPEELIIQEGKKGHSMFVMVSGEASVFVNRLQASRFASGGAFALGTKQEESDRQSLEQGIFNKQTAQKVKHLTVGSIFGELAMLGIAPKRSATVQAETLCSLWEICQAKVLSVLADFGTFRNRLISIISMYLEPTVSWRLGNMPLFKDFDQQFRLLLGLSCLRRVYFPGQTIAREGQRGQGVIIMNVGEAKFEHGNILVTTYHPGSYMGCETMLGVQKVYNGTLTATEVCHVLIITHDSYRVALQKYPSVKSSAALLETVTKETQAFQATMKRMRLKLFVVQRCAAALQSQPEEEPQNIHVGMLESELQARTFQAWSLLTAKRSKLHRQNQLRHDKEQEWVTRQLGARKHRLMEEHLALQQSKRFGWTTPAEWDSSTNIDGGRPRQSRLPQIAPIGGPSLRSLGLERPEPRGPSAARSSLPPIST